MQKYSDNPVTVRANAVSTAMCAAVLLHFLCSKIIPKRKKDADNNKLFMLSAPFGHKSRE